MQDRQAIDFPENIQQSQPGCILVVTATRVEAQAVLKIFLPGKETAWQVIGKKTYYSLGVQGGVPVFMVQCEMGTAGPGGSLLTILQAIQDLQPQAVIMCGIAFGLRPTNQELGDILVSKQLMYFEPQKVKTGSSPIHRGDKITASVRLLDHFRNGDLHFVGAKRHFGLIVSGEKLINDSEFTQQLLAAEPEAIGGEMEGAGLYAASRAGNVDWILVKAICDWADGSKNDHYQPIAARNAAKFVFYVLSLGGWSKTSPAGPAELLSRPAPPGKPVPPPDPASAQAAIHPVFITGIVRDILSSEPTRLQALQSLGQIEPQTDGPVHQNIRQELLRILQETTRPTRERTNAGDGLALLGDPRFRPDAWFLPDDDCLGFVKIPAGQFSMGANSSLGKDARANDLPQHNITLPDFYIAKFPVTVAQYRAFLHDQGKAGASATAGVDNHPATSLSWYEALEYCRWLTDCLRLWPNPPEDVTGFLSLLKTNPRWIVTLPSEAEWEKAARGSTDRRDYPWGLETDPERANYKATGLDTTSSVGCFPNGRSPYGLEDMSGNVYEWTRSLWGSNLETPQFRYPYIARDGRENPSAQEKVLRINRGGSYHSPAGHILCSYRGAESPAHRLKNVGFRLAICMTA